MANLKISSSGLAASGKGRVEITNTVVCGCLPFNLDVLTEEKETSS